MAPDIQTWMHSLRVASVVGTPGACAPLILDAAGRLYLYRYWDYEQRLARDLLERVAQTTDDIDRGQLKACLARLFPAPDDPVIDWQMMAAAVAALKRFCVISGGPGTGKTTTVARLLALLLEQHDDTDPLRIALVAPTGKAAARLQESLRAAKPGLDTDAATREAIPEQAATIHRLLGVRPNSNHFRHGPDNLLPLDVLIVDEASMVDVALMTHLVEALPASARLVLLGDKDQLASVKAGAVLGDICAQGDSFSAEFAALVESVTDVSLTAHVATGSRVQDAVVVLRHSYRFGADSGIGDLANAVNAGDAAQSLRILADPAREDATFSPTETLSEFEAAILEDARAEYGPCFDAVARHAPAEEVLAAFGRFRFLCAHRDGQYSAGHINQLITDWLRHNLRIRAHTDWYAGRPVMITRNDYNLHLYNGDIGVALPAAGQDSQLRVFFQSPEGGLRSFAPARLPAHETVYAMTVHKSQGSEFDHVALVLPEKSSSVTTRELIYTGLTRAKCRVHIRGTAQVLSASIEQVMSRASGLQQLLGTGTIDLSATQANGHD